MAWQPGQSGNPQGGPRGVGDRQQLAKSMLKKLRADFEKHGIGAIEACRKKDPAKYLTIVASFVPKEATLNVQHSFSDLLLEAAKRMQEQAQLPTQTPPAIEQTITVEYTESDALEQGELAQLVVPGEGDRGE